MGIRKRRISAHEAGEETPCDACLHERRLVERSKELQDEYGLDGGALLKALLESLQYERELEKMWRRRPKPERSPQ
jgi:hypothetical protein